MNKNVRLFGFVCFMLFTFMPLSAMPDYRMRLPGLQGQIGLESVEVFLGIDGLTYRRCRVTLNCPYRGQIFCEAWGNPQVSCRAKAVTESQFVTCRGVNLQNGLPVDILEFCN